MPDSLRLFFCSTSFVSFARHNLFFCYFFNQIQYSVESWGTSITIKFQGTSFLVNKCFIIQPLDDYLDRSISCKFVKATHTTDLNSTIPGPCSAVGPKHNGMVNLGWSYWHHNTVLSVEDKKCHCLWQKERLNILQHGRNNSFTNTHAKSSFFDLDAHCVLSKLSAKGWRKSRPSYYF